MKRGLIAGVVVAAVAVLALVGRVLYDLFSLEGIGYAVGIGDGAGLFAPGLTRALFWVLVVLVAVEGPVLVVKRADWREGRLTPGSRREAWLAAHVSLVKRVRARVGFAMDGWEVHLKQRERAADLAYKQVGRGAPAVEDRRSDEAEDAA
jgi:hypothetical protein